MNVILNALQMTPKSVVCESIATAPCVTHANDKYCNSPHIISMCVATIQLTILHDKLHG